MRGPQGIQHETTPGPGYKIQQVHDLGMENVRSCYPSLKKPPVFRIY